MTRNSRWRWCGLLAGMVGTLLYAAQSPLFSGNGPEAAAYGEAEHYPVGSPGTMMEQKNMVGAYSHFDLLFPSRGLKPASQAWPFQRPAEPPTIGYFHAGKGYSLEEYLAHLPVTGLLIAKDDQILFEGYQYGRTDKDRMTSQSMSKTITAMLMGVAVSEGAVASVNDVAGKYLPELKDAPFGKVSIRDLLHMSSGVACEPPHDDPGQIDMQTLVHGCKTVAPAGAQFKYSAADSQLLGLIVQRAVKMPLSQYLEQRIWRNIGTEANATWTINAHDQEVAFCCFNAVLRDYARFGRLLAFDGAWNGKQLIPWQWMLDGTTVNDADTQLAPGKPIRFFGYGYQTWILPGARRMFGLLGANGQRIFVDPQSKLVMVQTAVMQKEVDPARDAEIIALWMALVRHFGSA